MDVQLEYDFVCEFEFHFNLFMSTLVFPFMRSISFFLTGLLSIEIYLDSKDSQKNYLFRQT